jgi:hypothetical protein
LCGPRTGLCEIASPPHLASLLLDVSKPRSRILISSQQVYSGGPEFEVDKEIDPTAARRLFDHPVVEGDPPGRILKDRKFGLSAGGDWIRTYGSGRDSSGFSGLRRRDAPLVFEMLDAVGMTGHSPRATRESAIWVCPHWHAR